MHYAKSYKLETQSLKQPQTVIEIQKK